MADIDFVHPHAMSKKDAKAATARAVQDLEDRLDASSRWDGDTLHFNRSGTDGRLEVGQKEVRVVLNLSWMLKPMKGQIRSQAEDLLNTHLRRKKA